MSRTNVRTVVCIPNYNGGDFLRESVISILDQTRAADRVLVVDDGSSDGSVDSLADLENRDSLEVIRYSRNRGKAEILNEIFAEVEADYFLIQDADDVALPNRVESQVDFMEANPDVGCSSGFLEYIGKDGAPVGVGRLDLTDRERLREYLAGDEPFGLFCPCVILRGDVVKNPELRFRGRFWPADDIDLWNRIAEAGHTVLAQPKVLVKYRVHGNSAVTSNFVNTRMQFEWVRECMRARREGRAEPDYQSFQEKWNSVSILGKVNRSRKIHAKAYYRSGGFARAEGSWMGCLYRIAMAGLLQPSYVWRRLGDQVFKKR